jgi:PAS domain S-box-containing protein
MPDGQLAQDAERLIKALEHFPEAVSIVSPLRDGSGTIVDLVVEHVNVAGESAAELAMADAGLVAAYREVIETGRPAVRSVEYEGEQDGRRRVSGAFEVRISKFGDGALSIFRDVTEQHVAAAAALRESEERYRALMEHAPEAIVVLDVEAGRFHQVNQNAARLFGLPPNELLKLGPVDLSPPNQPDGRPSTEAAREQIALAVDGGTPTFEWSHRAADGREIPCEVRLVRLPASDRVLVRGSVTDISERERATADTLQHSLLPDRIPEIPGVVIAARYRPAGERFQVGGDFYDVFQIADSRWLLVVGDVCGKGPAAATLTALARYTLRAEAMHEPRPAELLGLLTTPSCASAPTDATAPRCARRSTCAGTASRSRSPPEATPWGSSPRWSSRTCAPSCTRATRCSSTPTA